MLISTYWTVGSAPTPDITSLMWAMWNTANAGAARATTKDGTSTASRDIENPPSRGRENALRAPPASRANCARLREGYGAIVARRSATKASTLPSTGVALTGSRQPPAAVAFAYAFEKAASATARQPGSFEPLPFPTAFEWHLILADAFFPAAASSFEEHLLAVPDPPTSIDRRSFTKPSTLPPTVAALAAVRQPPAAIALAYALPKLASVFARQVDSLPPLPFATAFDSHLSFADAFLPAAASSFEEHLLLPDGAIVVVVVVAPGVVVVVVVAPGAVVVVVPPRPIMPALFVGVGAARAKSATLLFVDPVRLRLCEPLPAARVVGVPEEELTPSASGSEVLVVPV